MDEEIRRKMLTRLDQHRTMTIATLRPDDWPQATTVGYANEGLTLYFLCGPNSQKAGNLARDDRVSLDDRSRHAAGDGDHRASSRTPISSPVRRVFGSEPGRDTACRSRPCRYPSAHYDACAGERSIATITSLNLPLRQSMSGP